MAKRRSATVLFALFLLGAALVPRGFGQFTAEEIARRGFWEKFLETAEILRTEPLGSGVTGSMKLYLKSGDVEKKAAWKCVDDQLATGGLDCWRFEIAAYRLDKLIGLHMVPPAVEREHLGRRGSLVLWADSKYSALAMSEQGIQIPEAALDRTSKMGYVFRLWQCLIANDDPTLENILYTEDWRMILIDHSRAFRSDKAYTDRLVLGVDGIKKHDNCSPYLIRRVPRDLLARITELDEAAIKRAVGPYLTDREVYAVAVRAKLIKAEIATMIHYYGEDSVLY
jgi:hypothetical protein